MKEKAEKLVEEINELKTLCMREFADSINEYTNESEVSMIVKVLKLMDHSTEFFLEYVKMQDDMNSKLDKMDSKLDKILYKMETH